MNTQKIVEKHKIKIMKSSSKILLSTTFLFAALFAFAAQHTVSKDPNRVAQYTDLQLAIDDALDGDTILVYGAATNYGNINLYKPLVLIGEGYNSNNSLITTISTLSITRFNTTLSASGSTIMGFYVLYNTTFNANFTGATDPGRLLDNITLLRNNLGYINMGSTGIQTFSNINFLNNIIRDYITLDPESYDLTFSNCIFDGAYFQGSLSRSGGVLSTYADLSNVKVYNSLFLNYETGLLNQTVGMVFEDNIFFGHELYYNDYAQVTWNNNLFYLVDQTVNLFTNDNVGSGNLLDTNPLFNTYPATPAAFSYSHDYTLQAGSPALTASVGGGEIGIYGGAYPFAVGARPPVPRITEVTIQDGTSSVPVGGTINFNFKAESGN